MKPIKRFNWTFVYFFVWRLFSVSSTPCTWKHKQYWGIHLRLWQSNGIEGKQQPEESNVSSQSHLKKYNVYKECDKKKRIPKTKVHNDDGSNTAVVKLVDKWICPFFFQWYQQQHTHARTQANSEQTRTKRRTKMSHIETVGDICRWITYFAFIFESHRKITFLCVFRFLFIGSDFGVVQNAKGKYLASKRQSNVW